MNSLPELQIRQITVADIELYLRMRITFLSELADTTETERDAAQVTALEEGTRRYLTRMVPHPELFAGWVVEIAGAPIATGGLVFFDRPPTAKNLNGREGYVFNMYTRPEWRGRGIATALLKTICAYAHANGAARVWLRATEAGRPVYARFGFTENPELMELKLV